MPALTTADTIRILVATDNHVGYNERDPVRGDDSWKSFHEIMCLAKDRDVDMVLLAGDLFHENKPSRKSMYNVMRSLRMNCYGDKPCELEMLSDGSEHFDGTFGHVNYEDPDINVAIPVFSIHGNHDDPSGEGHLAALDILEMSGLINYYGRTPESDNINVKPVLLQKGRTKLALYGLSNVRDERLYRTFRDGKVKFFQPSTQKEDWFNMICVHQNHHAYTETSHLPENFLPEFLDLVIWGHEHECDIQPHLNPEMNFKVMQPGSSVATSLVAGEAIPKQVAIVNITGRDFKSEPVRLKTVRPFVYKDLVLAKEKEALRIAKKENHRAELTRFLMRVVEDLVEEARAEWQETQDERRKQDPEADDDDEPPELPLPLIRLRVETTAADGGNRFDCENPQRFSNRFIGKVANTNDVIQFYAKKRSTLSSRRDKDDETERDIMAKFQGLDTVKVEALVREFLAAQSLTILPQNYFGDAVSQFIDKDDKQAMEAFVNESLANQIKHLIALHSNEDEDDEEDEEVEGSLMTQIERYRSQLEELFAKGALKKSKSGRARYKPKPDGWDSDLDGEWEDQPGALMRPDEMAAVGDDGEDENEEGAPAPRAPVRGGRGRGRGGTRGSTSAAVSSARGKARAAGREKAPAAAAGRGRKKVVDDDDDEEEDEDIIMLDDNDDEDRISMSVDDEDEQDSQAMFFTDKAGKKAPARSTTTSTRASAPTKTTSKPSAVKKPSARTRAGAAATKSSSSTRANKAQSTLNFTTSQQSMLGNARRPRSANIRDDVEDDDDDDDDDAFEPVTSSARTGTRAGTGMRGRR